MVIYVTADDIGLGQRKNCRHCPVAEAIARVFGRPCYVMIGGGYFAHTNVEFYLSKDISNWITRFDAGASVSPVQFELPDALLEELKNVA